jgi:group I intron endonuclease
MFNIYCATNKKNGKKYIGYTNNFHRRKIQHKSSAKCGSLYVFHKAIRKYGWDNFDWEILFQSENYQITIDKEVELIEKNETKIKGYNLTLGGEGQKERNVSLETRNKMSQNHANMKKENNPFWKNKHTLESKKMMSESLKGKSSPLKGKKLSKEHRDKLSFALKGNNNRIKNMVKINVSK